MSTHELLVLSPYRLPTQSPMMFGSDEVAALLNGHAALWHPAALRTATAPPRLASPYDHEQPQAGFIYATPDNPPLLLPDDWDQRVSGTGGLAFRATADRQETLDNLRAALRQRETPSPLIDLPPELVAPFLGIGLGFLMVNTLFEAMDHENLLAADDLWQDLQQAIAVLETGGDAAAIQPHLQAAADRLLTAREVLYPVTVFIIDIATLDERHLDRPLPAALEHGAPLNLVASGAALEALGRQRPELLARLRELAQLERLELCGGPYLEREDALLPVDSQLWNLLHGLAVSKELLGVEVRVFARRRFAHHPQLPLLLSTSGLSRALVLPCDTASLPSYRAVITSWPSPDGKQVDAFTRTPYAAADASTFYHLAYYLRQTIMQDQTAAIALLHGDKPAAPWYADWLELNRFGPVLGTWSPLTRLFNEGMTGDYGSAASPDDFHSDYLEERTNFWKEPAGLVPEQGAAPPPFVQYPAAGPVSGFARHLRDRRRIDTAWTLAGLHRGLGPTAAGPAAEIDLEKRLTAAEQQVELGRPADLPALEKEVAERLAGRLVARAAGEQPGFLVLNPCSFTRRVALELDGVPGPLPLTGPLKAGQFADGKARVVVEVPALGFAWFPRQGPPGTPHPAGRVKLADKMLLHNEFLEAEIDPQTGGLKAIRDLRTRINRVGQQLVYNPGSKTRVKEIKVTSTGPALGEIVTEGGLLDEHDQVLAAFRQRFRVWLGRPLLEMRIEIYPEKPPVGYPWHAYYGARFAWRDERSLLLRGVNGTGFITSHTRPETPDYLELRQGKQATVLFPGGLPFHQRHGSRMLDVILHVEGETAQVFDLALALDREQPTQTALGVATPVPVVPTAKGPPHVGATGWLFHLDAANLLLSSLRPAPDGADGVIARLLECTAYNVQANLRCVRDPQQARTQTARGEPLMEATTMGDAVDFEVGPSDLVHLHVDFTRPAG